MRSSIDAQTARERTIMTQVRSSGHLGWHQQSGILIVKILILTIITDFVFENVRLKPPTSQKIPFGACGLLLMD